MKRLFSLFLLLILAAVPATADPIDFSGSIRLRAEAWSWFETPGHDDDYVFFASLIRAGASQKIGNFSWQLEGALPTLFNLPDGAIAPPPQGQLGLGATYYAANGEEDPAALFVKQAWLRYSAGDAFFRLGRFEFAEGAEVAPKNPRLAALKRDRIAQRLIGPFGFSHVARSFDGLHAGWTRGGLNATLVAAQPTTGAFKVDGGRQLDDVAFAYGSVTRSEASADGRLFAILYRDSRGVVKTDNRPLNVRTLDREDVEIQTVGGHYLRAIGNYDVLGWAAFQFGDWGILDHQAWAVALEGGRHWSRSSLRGGVFISSGDDDAGDDDHGTFFQVLPTPRIYARFPFYNAMNSQDVFVQGAWRATDRVTFTSELHNLRLQSDDDLWYAGGGAFEKPSFGFAGRPSFGQSELATTVDIGAQISLGAKMALGVYGGYAAGGEIVESIFSGSDGTFAYVELTRSF